MIARLLVSSNQIGCLLGKGGSMMAETRKSTGGLYSYIPKCASENAEVVQVCARIDSFSPLSCFIFLILFLSFSSIVMFLLKINSNTVSKSQEWLTTYTYF